MQFLLEGAVSNWLQKILAGIICNITKSTMENMVSFVNDFGGELGMEPSSYNSLMWGAIESITENAIAPIATLILTALMLIELIGWANTQNNMHTATDVIGDFIKFFIKLFIGIYLVTKSHDITLLVFKISSYVISSSGSALSTDVDYSVISDASISALQTQLESCSLWTLVPMLLPSFLGWLGVFVVAAVCRVIILGRVIQIYMYCSIGAIPYATFMNKELSGVGKNYIMNLFALAFQGFFMLVAITIYGYMVASITYEAALTSFFGLTSINLKLICSGFALCFTLIGSKSLAKSIFNAH